MICHWPKLKILHEETAIVLEDTRQEYTGQNARAPLLNVSARV